MMRMVISGLFKGVDVAVFTPLLIVGAVEDEEIVASPRRGVDSESPGVVSAFSLHLAWLSNKLLLSSSELLEAMDVFPSMMLN